MSTQGGLHPWNCHIAVPGNTTMAFSPPPGCCCPGPKATLFVSLNLKVHKSKPFFVAVPIPLSLKAATPSGGPGGKEVSHHCLCSHLYLHLGPQRHNKNLAPPSSKTNPPENYAPKHIKHTFMPGGGQKPNQFPNSQTR